MKVILNKEILEALEGLVAETGKDQNSITLKISFCGNDYPERSHLWTTLERRKQIDSTGGKKGHGS